jgi:hypothetical protein
VHHIVLLLDIDDSRVTLSAATADFAVFEDVRAIYSFSPLDSDCFSFFFGVECGVAAAWRPRDFPFFTGLFRV